MKLNKLQNSEESSAPSPKKRGRPSKKASAPSASGQFNIDAFLKIVNAKFGEGTVFRASDGIGMVVQHISTGAYRLDFALGGGFPKGRLSELYGNESAGKSTLCLKTVAEFQRAHLKGIAVYIDFERTFDPKYAQMVGVDIDRLIVINPDQGEQGADLLDLCLQQKVDQLIIVDSLAAMMSSTTMEITADKQEMGVQARMINRVVAKANARMKRNLVDPDYPTSTVIMVNQIRQKIGVMFGNPETTPGGLGKNFFTSLRLKIFSSGAKANKIEVPVTKGGIKRDVLVGRNISFSVEKNKTGGVSFEDGEYTYYIKPYKGHKPWTFDNEEALFDSGRFYGAITVDKKGNFVYDDICFKQEAAFIKALRDDEETSLKLHDEIIERMKEFNAGELAEAQPDEDDES